MSHAVHISQLPTQSFGSGGGCLGSVVFGGIQCLWYVGLTITESGQKWVFMRGMSKRSGFVFD